jgi:hypothetical protein
MAMIRDRKELCRLPGDSRARGACVDDAPVTGIGARAAASANPAYCSGLCGHRAPQRLGVKQYDSHVGSPFDSLGNPSTCSRQDGRLWRIRGVLRRTRRAGAALSRTTVRPPALFARMPLAQRLPSSRRESTATKTAIVSDDADRWTERS